ncbi:MAG: hypothetical protein ACK5V8_09015 [Betaproteobacteria bacterium]
MTIDGVSTIFDGTLRAARLLPLAFTLAAVPALTAPAAAQLPRLAPVAAAVQQAAATVPGDSEPLRLVDAARGTPLQLAARHVAVEVRGDMALVHTLLTYRNTGTAPVEALYSVPLPATLTGPQDAVAVLPDVEEEIDGCGGGEQVDASDADTAAAHFPDLPAELLAELIETSDPLALLEHGSVLLAPGEEVTFTLTRPLPLEARGAARRALRLPLGEPAADGAAPHWSAEVLVHAEQPITALAAPGHDGAVVQGLGERSAALQIAQGPWSGSRHLAIEFELGAPPPRLLAFWGGEARGATHGEGRGTAARPPVGQRSRGG